MSQLSFAFQSSPETDFYREVDFLILEENSAAVNFLQKFFEQKNFPGDYTKAQFQSMILKGPQSSGKSHVLHFMARKHGAEILHPTEIRDVNPLSLFSADKFYILEDIDRVDDEEWVLRMINSAAESRAFLVMSMRSAAKFTLKDLVSRLRNIFSVEIKQPTEESMKHLLVKGLSRKQIFLPTRAIDFVLHHLERNHEAVRNAVKLIDFYCLEYGKELTMKDLGEIF